LSATFADPLDVSNMSNRVDSLTGLRFFAALAIVIHHLKGQLLIPAGSLSGFQFSLGVSFFFVLSGFILQYSYRKRLGSAGGMNYSQFVALRFLRLWPTHIAVIALIVVANGQWVLSYYWNNYTVGQLFASVFLLQAWSASGNVVFSLNSAAWSISVEMFLYAMFPLLCKQALISPFRALSIAAAVSFGWLTAIWLYMPNGNYEFLAGTHPFARLFEFGVGIFAYELIHKKNSSFKSSTAIECVFMGLAVSMAYLTPIIVSAVNPYLAPHLGWWLANCSAFWAFAALIGVFSLQAGAISRYFAFKPVAYLGDISFALYLVHLPLIMYLSKFAPWFQQSPFWAQVFMFSGILLGLSSAIHHFIEKPIVAVSKRFIL
jgi:peptidoglycan/LPS O-acetylase OafA/YrhL